MFGAYIWQSTRARPFAQDSMLYEIHQCLALDNVFNVSNQAQYGLYLKGIIYMTF